MQRVGVEAALVAHADRGRARAGNRREIRDAIMQRFAPDRIRIADRALLLDDRVDDQRDLVVLDHVDDVRLSLEHLVDDSDRHARIGQRFRGAARGHELEVELVENPRQVSAYNYRSNTGRAARPSRAECQPGAPTRRCCLSPAQRASSATKPCMPATLTSRRARR